MCIRDRGYMSPEQLLARPLDARSDLFSFGVVLYRMVTGRLPFEGNSSITSANSILHLHFEPREFGDGSIPEKLKAIFRKLLQKDPETRYSSAEEVEAELKALEVEMAPARSAGLSGTAWVAVAADLVVVVSVGGRQEPSDGLPLDTGRADVHGLSLIHISDPTRPY